MSAIDGAEHRARIGLAQAAAAESDQLVQQAQGIAHAAFGRSRYQRHRRRIELQMLSSGDELQTFADERGRQPLEAELQTAGKHGDGQLLRVGGRQQEFDMGRRLFQRLEQGIEGVIGEHVDFVDEVHLEAASARRVLHVIEQLAGVVHFRARGCVYLDEIDEAAFVDLPACGADAAGIRTHAGGLTIQRLR